MSQHDMNIADDTGANVRADLNNAFGAIASSHSGSSAPSTAFSWQVYYNTTDKISYQYDGTSWNRLWYHDAASNDVGLFGGLIDDNKVWVLNTSTTASAVNYLEVANAQAGASPTISTAGSDTDVDINFAPKGAGIVKTSSPVEFSSTSVFQSTGSAGSPSIYFGTDSNSGIYRVSENVLAMSASGIEGFRINSTGVTLSSASVTGTAGFQSTGTAGAPSIYFGADVNSGFYRSAENVFHASTSGVVRTTWGASAAAAFSVTGSASISDDLTVTNQVECDTVRVNEIYADDGSASDPSYTFENAKSIGLFFDGSAALGVSVANTATAYFGLLGFIPGSDNTYTLGNAITRWSTVYAATGTINTSDINLKQDIEELSDAETRVACRVKKLVRRYRWRDAVEEKGDEARYHFGVMAQDVVEAFEAEGLDPLRYGIVCRDEVDGVGFRYGIRYDELAMFLISTT